jgi:hypothetical protein
MFEEETGSDENAPVVGWVEIVDCLLGSGMFRLPSRKAVVCDSYQLSIL